MGSLFLCTHNYHGTEHYDIACVHALHRSIHNIVGTLILQCIVLSYVYSLKEKSCTIDYIY